MQKDSLETLMYVVIPLMIAIIQTLISFSDTENDYSAPIISIFVIALFYVILITNEVFGQREKIRFIKDYIEICYPNKSIE